MSIPIPDSVTFSAKEEVSDVLRCPLCRGRACGSATVEEEETASLPVALFRGKEIGERVASVAAAKAGKLAARVAARDPAVLEDHHGLYLRCECGYESAAATWWRIKVWAWIYAAAAIVGICAGTGLLAWLGASGRAIAVLNSALIVGSIVGVPIAMHVRFTRKRSEIHDRVLAASSARLRAKASAPRSD